MVTVTTMDCQHAFQFPVQTMLQNILFLLLLYMNRITKLHQKRRIVSAAMPLNPASQDSTRLRKRHISNTIYDIYSNSRTLDGLQPPTASCMHQNRQNPTAGLPVWPTRASEFLPSSNCPDAQRACPRSVPRNRQAAWGTRAPRGRWSAVHVHTCVLATACALVGRVRLTVYKFSSPLLNGRIQSCEKWMRKIMCACICMRGYVHIYALCFDAINYVMA